MQQIKKQNKQAKTVKPRMCLVLSQSVISDSSYPMFMGIPQARILVWVAMSSSRGSSQPRDQIQVSRIAGGFFTIWATREAQTKNKKILL